MWKRRKPEPEAADGAADLGPEFDARVEAILDEVRAEADRILDEARRKAAALGRLEEAELSEDVLDTSDAPAGDPPADGRQTAVQMAAAGATRSQVEAHLLEFWELGDPTLLLDHVFGPASADDTRVPWAIAGTDPQGARPN